MIDYIFMAIALTYLGIMLFHLICDNYEATVTKVQNDYIRDEYPDEVKGRKLLKHPYMVNVDSDKIKWFTLGKIFMGIPDELEQWCDEHFENKWMEGWPKEKSVDVCFQNGDDAMAFKLRWL